MKNTFIGSPVERREDLRFVRGRGQYVDDLHPAGLLYAVILRSSVAHGSIRAIDTAGALGIKGVHAVITAKDMPGGPPKIAMRLQPLPEFKPFEQPVIADGKVRYVGEPVAVVLADSVAIGEDALEHIVLDIEPLPAVTDCAAAARGDRLLFESHGTNRAMTFTAACGDVDAAFAAAAYVRREKLRTQRHYGLTMEPRGVLAQWEAGRLTVYGAAKVPFFNRRILAKQIGLPEDAIDMVENDVGGGFGARGEFYPEDFLIPFAARHVGRPVKWIEDRRENLMAMNHAREAAVDVEIACDRDGMILGLRGHADVDMGAYMRTNGAVGARNIAQFMSGPYRIPNIRLDSTLWMTNKTPVGTYRGPGRFETDFFRERLLDVVAADLGIDRVEFRRRNLIPASAMPYPFPTITPFESKDEVDSGDYGVSLDRCLAEFGWAEKSKLAGRVIDGRHHGLAIGCFIEGGAAGPKETAKLEIGADGAVTVFIGSSAVGQGVETVFAQIAADALEIPIDRITDVFHGSTAYVSDGYGAYHSRSVVMGGSALLDAVKNLHEAIRGEAAQALGLRAVRRRDYRGPNRRSRWAERDLRRVRRDVGGRHLPQQEAHLHLRRACCARHRRRPHRRGRDPRLPHRRRLRPHHQSDDGARAGDRLAGAGARRRHAGKSRLRRGGPAAHRHARRLFAADRERLSQPPRHRHRRFSLADQSARRQGRRGGRHHRRRRHHGERGRQRAQCLRRRAARAAADAGEDLGDGRGRPEVSGFLRGVIPGRASARTRNPEIVAPQLLDSGFTAARCPGMTGGV